MGWPGEATARSAETKREGAVVLGEAARIWLASGQHYRRSCWMGEGKRSSGCGLLGTGAAAVQDAWVGESVMKARHA